MAEFGYEAINGSGKTVKGSLVAEDIDAARADLKSKGLMIVSLNAQTALTKDLSFDIGGKPTSKDLSIFCRMFVSMTKAGVTIIEALEMLEDQTENKKMRKAIKEARINVEKGDTLANSLALNPNVFPELMIQLVTAGEASGNIDTAMERMAIQFEKATKTQSAVRGAMIYPIIVAIVALGVIVLMLMVVIPNFTSMFADLGTDLPQITKTVVAMSDYLIANWYIIFPIVAVIFFAFAKFTKTNTGKRTLGWLALKIPAVRNLVVKSAAALMARTLSTLLAAGVPLPDSVQIVSKTMSNVYFRDALEKAAEEIKVGVPLSKPLEDCGLFPPMVHHMVRIGEESGSVEDMLTKLADYYDDEVDEATSALMQFMQPIIILLLAGLVVTLMGAVLAPMMTMYDAIETM